MYKLTVTIITLNEEKDISRCLASVKGVADEIVVVDSGSTDRTAAIARDYGAKVFCRKFDNYANQKNFAVSKASGDWILSIDADEEIEPELAEEIEFGIQNLESRKKNPENKNITYNIQNTIYDVHPVAYSIPRKNIIFGKFIKYTRWQPELDRHIWLWKKDSGKWVGDVHEEVVVKGDVGRLRYAKIHYQYETVEQFLDMENRYSEIEAKEKVGRGQRFSYFRFIIDPKYNFLVRYFYRLGFLDGWRGFVLSYLMGIYHFIVWVKVWEKSRNG